MHRPPRPPRKPHLTESLDRIDRIAWTARIVRIDRLARIARVGCTDAFYRIDLNRNDRHEIDSIESPPTHAESRRSSQRTDRRRGHDDLASLGRLDGLDGLDHDGLDGHYVLDCLAGIVGGE